MTEHNGHNGNKALRWKQNRQIFKDVEFPSGAIADLQRVDTQDMIAEDGSIPDTFYAMVMEQEQAQSRGEAFNVSGAEAKEFLKTQTYLTVQAARKAFVSPRIADEADYENDVIAIADLTSADKQFLWGWLTSGGTPAEALRRFRQAQQGGSVVAAPSMPSVLPASVAGNGDNG